MRICVSTYTSQRFTLLVLPFFPPQQQHLFSLSASNDRTLDMDIEHQHRQAPVFFEASEKGVSKQLSVTRRSSFWRCGISTLLNVQESRTPNSQHIRIIGLLTFYVSRRFFPVTLSDKMMHVKILQWTLATLSLHPTEFAEILCTYMIHTLQKHMDFSSYTFAGTGRCT